MARRADVGLMLVIALASGCGRSLTRSSERPTPAPPPQTTEASTPQPAAPSATPASERGTLALRVFDDNGLHPADIPVEIAGEETRRLISDSSGTVRFVAKPGRYAARVVKGCHADVFVELGGTARFGLVGGRTTEGALRAVWIRRFGPTGDAPVSVSEAGDWRIGDRVTVTFGVADRCNDEPAPSASLHAYTYDLSRNLKIRDWPLRSNREGVARLVLSCTAAGDIAVVVKDEANPTDQVDIGRYATGYGGPPRCVE